MPGVSALQVTTSPDKAQASFPQVIERTGLKSREPRSRAMGERAQVLVAVPRPSADSAGRDAAAGWRRRYQDWMKIGIPRRTGTDLFARLPFDHAMTLAALVGIGRMTWQEVHAALDAMIKLAAADARDEHLDEFPPHTAQCTAEDEIWARYHAQCDEIFAGADADDRSPEQLWHRERILDRLRSARDRATSQPRAAA